MATWTEIAASATTAGKPVDEALMTAYKENVKAVAEGATGAPRIEKEAIDDAGIEAGTNLIINKSFTANPNTPQSGLQHTIRVAGTYNVRVDITGSNDAGGVGFAQFDLNGTPTGPLTTAGNKTATGTNQVFTLSAGDLIKVNISESSASNRTSMTTRLRMGISDQSAVAYGLPLAEQDSFS